MDKTQTKSERLNRILISAALAVAFWPVWSWYLQRCLDKSDEPWGLCALATAIFFMATHKSTIQSGPDEAAVDAEPRTLQSEVTLPGNIMLVGGILTLLLYIVTFTLVPNLARAVMLVFAIWSLLVSRFAVPSRAGMLGLLLLSLPLIPSLNFFAGYPLRLLVGKGACVLLSMLGFSAVQNSTMLVVNNQLIAVDAPCSGINMLWAEGYMVMLFACLYQLRVKSTVILSTAALFLIIAANALRAAALVIVSKIDVHSFLPNVQNPDDTVHVATGLVTFCLTTTTTMGLAYFVSHREKKLALKPSAKRQKGMDRQANNTTITTTGNKNDASNAVAIAKPSIRFNAHADWLQTPKGIPVTATLVGLSLCAASMPFLTKPVHSEGFQTAPRAWPGVINGAKVVPVASLAEERAFAADFPGQMKRFTDGTNSYFVRFVCKETRQLHPSSDCFRGLGYKVNPGPLVTGEQNSHWSSFEATKDDHKYRILERISDENGNAWTDVSQWYWAASFAKTRGPWWDVTIAQPLKN
jgi:exosortase/archaeosortase family protein